VEGLRAAGFDVKLANTSAIAQYSGLKYSGDEHNARHLAYLLRLKLLKFGYVFEPQWRSTRDLTGKRQQLVRTRTTRVLAFETIFASETGSHISGDAVNELDAVNALDLVDVLKWGWAEDVTLAAQVNVLPPLCSPCKQWSAESPSWRNGCKSALSWRRSTRYGRRRLEWAKFCRPSSCLRQARLNASPLQGTMHLLPVESVAAASRTTRKVKGTAERQQLLGTGLCGSHSQTSK
jgi:hypothetical protein